MFDINFFKNTHSLKSKIVNKSYGLNDESFIFNELEKLRNNEIYIFNLETSNNCNMRCIMCPRTTQMTRKIQTMNDEDFEEIISQLKPHTKEEFEEFIKFIYDEYGIDKTTRSENAFYFFTSSRCLTLHGFGEPLIDPNIIKRIKACKQKNIPTYFSCVPANINVEKITNLMQNGLDVIKFSIDALDDMEAKAIRGKRNNFTEAYLKIQEILKIKKEQNLKTLIICTMLDLSTDKNSINKQKRFIEIFKDQDVFAYVKSLDNRWYNDLDESLKNKSHYESQYCEFAWSSLTVMANGEIVPCTQDYNTEMSFGNIKEKSLKEVWNSKEYENFRKWHINGNFPKGHKCKERCDIKKIYQYLDKK